MSLEICKISTKSDEICSVRLLKIAKGKCKILLEALSKLVRIYKDVKYWKDKGVVFMDENKKSDLLDYSSEMILSTAGSLVGFVIGGPIGAAAGGAFSPTTKMAIKVGQLWLQKRKNRMTNIVERAFIRSGKNEETIIQEMISSQDWCDSMMSMIQQLADGDPELDVLFSEIMALAISSDDEGERNRLIVLNSSIKGMNKVQVLILKEMYLSGGVLSAHDMAEQVQVPELELRNAVRDLELRGMIVDNGKEPTVWSLRELGIAVVKTIETVDIVER